MLKNIVFYVVRAKIKVELGKLDLGSFLNDVTADTLEGDTCNVTCNG